MNGVEPIITFNAEGNGGVLLFREPAEIKTWIDREKTFFNWLVSARNSDGNLAEPCDRARRFWDGVTGAVGEIERTATNRPAQKQHIQRIIDLLTQNVGNKQVLLSTSAAGEFLNSLKDRGPKIAAFAYAAIVRSQIALNGSEAVEGYYEGLLFKKDIKGVAEAERATLEKLKNDFQSDQEALKTQQKDLVSKQTALQTEATQLIASHKQQHEAQLKTQKDQFEKQLADAKKELENLKKTYEEHMSLKAPVKYWSHRSWWQLAMAGLWISILWLGTWKVLTYDQVNLQKILIADKISFPQLGFALLVITLFFWGVRILVRLFLSNIHGFNDARERAVMVQTYLSLLEDGVAIKAEDRAFLLKTLFRPTVSGLVKDDAIPPFFEALGQLGRAGKG